MPPKPRRPDGLKLSLHGGTLLGLPQAGLPDRTFTRGQGCWNCTNAKSPIDRWFEKRSAKLAYATQIALQALDGESDPAVVKIRREIEQFDGMCAKHEMFVCAVGRTADGQPVGDFVASAFLCERWSGRVGASLARADDGRLDDLPEELRDKIDPSATIVNKLDPRGNPSCPPR